MAGKETTRPYSTMSGGSCSIGDGTSSAATGLDKSGVPEETRKAAWQQRENQTANIILQCPGCRFASSDMEALKNHACGFKTTHNCSVCGRQFKTPWSLTRHLHTHSEPSFVCGVCGKTFHTKDGYETHMSLFHLGAQD
ncbi:zinc finger protein 579-like [Dermacentor variabilis]|uniref:zinc finger protein 579-like n=1 Tax=Dermacentor variabilis TaxID=34621 RepID=UPI003F5BFA3C